MRFQRAQNVGHELYGPLVLYFNGVLLLFWPYKSIYTFLVWWKEALTFWKTFYFKEIIFLGLEIFILKKSIFG